MTWVFAALFLTGFFTLLWLFRRERIARHVAERRAAEFSSGLRRIQERIEEERARLETTFSGMVEGVLLTDERGEILHYNAAFQEMFGLKEKGVGRSALEVLASVACDDALQKVIQEKQPVEREIIFEKPKRRVFRVHLSPIRRNGKLSGVVSVFHDLTEIRRLEEVRRDFIANLSHELKTPLTAIRGYSETLLDEPSSAPEWRKSVEVIFRHAADLSKLVENLLNLSRIESGKEELRLEPVSLRALGDRLLERFSTEAKLKGVELVNEVPQDFPELWADAAQLNQILGNLVDNAVKYTPSGGRVRFRACRDNSQTEIVVEDNGPGIPKEDQERIFERFYRVDKARSRDTGGTGLGLAIVKHLVELHGGSVKLESAPGQGSRFHISFP